MGWYAVMNNLINTMWNEKSQTKKNGKEVLHYQGNQWFHHNWVSYLLPRAEAHSGRLKHQVQPIDHGSWGVNAESPFTGIGHKGLSREGFFPKSKKKKILKGSKVGFLSRISAHPKDGPQVMENKFDHPLRWHCQKGPLLIGGPLSLLPSRYQQTFCVRLCLPIHAGRSPVWPNRHIFPCGPVMSTMRLLYSSLSMTPTPICHLPHWGPEPFHHWSAVCTPFFFFF